MQILYAKTTNNKNDITELQKLMRRNAIPNKIFHDEYFYDILWQEFAR